MIAQILTILAPVVLVVLTGVAWDRLRQPYDTALVSNLVFYLGAPCLTFATLARFAIDPGAGRIALAAAAALLLFGVIGALLLRAFRMPVRPYVLTVMFPNLGNMGLPLALFAFGDAGLALSVIIFVIGTVAHSTIGVWILGGRMSPAILLRTPIVYGAAAALIFQFAHTLPPTWLLQATGLLGNLSVPLLLVTLGVSLSRMRITSMPRALQLSALRIGVGVSVGFAVAAVFGLTGVERGVLVLNAAMPSAVFNYLLAEKYNAAPADVAGGVALSTALSLVTLPLLLAVLLA